MILDNGTTIAIDHMVGGLEEDVPKEYIRLMLPMLYNMVYGEIMNDPMYINKTGGSNIHGMIVLQVIKNSPLLLSELLHSLDLEESVAEIKDIKHSTEDEHDPGTCFECKRITDDIELCIEAALAMLDTMPYIPELRQFMGIKGNMLSVHYTDPFSIQVTTHGTRSNLALDREFVTDAGETDGLLWNR